MRFILPLFLIMLLFPQPLRAEYFLRGRVITVDREKGEITVAVLNCGQCDPAAPAGQERQDTGRTEEEEVYIISSEFIPPCAAADAVISVWGELRQEKGEKRIQARRIAGPGGRHGQDSTGVRARLRKRCFMKQGEHAGPGPGEP
ncbi:MAG: hypothetical protein HY789_03660 [Deltaproteobacteria bacterium]|nr:hypothetical protein [Deltaproteobacteria bacterium]